MEAPTVRLIEKLFYEKIMLYNDLLHCFKTESELLIRIDLDKLWKTSKEKETICTRIAAARKEIVSAANPEKDQESFDLNRIMDLIPRGYKAEFQKLYLRLIKLKSEMDMLRKQNMIFIDDSLEFLDQMIAIITGNDRTQSVYNDKCHFSKSGSYVFLSREV